MGNKYYQIEDLTLIEQREVNGGILWEILVGAAVVAIINDWDNFKAGLSGKPEVAKKQNLKIFKIYLNGIIKFRNCCQRIDK